MQVIIITGSPGAGKTSTSNGLAEKLRINDIEHALLDPDEICRVYPEQNLTKIKWSGLNSIYEVFKDNGVKRIIIPVTIDNDNDLAEIQKSLSDSEIQIFSLVVDRETLIQRVVNREPNKFWQDTLSKLVNTYVQSEHARSYKRTHIDGNNKSVDDIVAEIYKKSSWN